MGKVIEKVKVTNIFDKKQSLELHMLVDTGATMVVLPMNIVKKLKLKKIRNVEVKYADNRIKTKPVYRGVIIEIFKRSSIFEVIGEGDGCQPLIGQVVLETLDLVVDSKSKKLMPNPASPDTPLIEII